jgi:hypothetical protein
MSNSATSPCLPSNPDIVAIGVRCAIYAQAFFALLPPTHGLWNPKVMPLAVDVVEAHSATVATIAFAMLSYTIIQALSQTTPLSNFHATIILNLSWMNSTCTFVCFLLHLPQSALERIRNDSLNVGWTGRPSGWVRLAGKVLQNRVYIIGSLHLTLMSAVGIWLWSKPAAFGHSPSCSLSASIVVIGRTVGFASASLRTWSLLVYALLLVPGLNLIPSAFFIVLLYFVRVKWTRWSVFRFMPSALSIGLAILAVVNVILLVDIELSIQKNPPPFLVAGRSPWSFGQTFGLLLFLDPISNYIKTFRRFSPETDTPSTERRTEFVITEVRTTERQAGGQEEGQTEAQVKAQAEGQAKEGLQGAEEGAEELQMRTDQKV